MSIKDWPADERPREKLLDKGANSLTDAELLAIFLRTGSAGLSAVDLARQSLTTFGSIGALLSADATQFCQVKGLGLAKYTQLQATLELAKRHLRQQLSERPTFDHVEKVKAYLGLQLSHLSHEVFAVLFLNQQHQLLAFRKMFEGTVNQTQVYPREVAKQALALNASAVIIAHNHPSGLTQPSDADHHITTQLQQALNLFDIRLLDHFIVGHQQDIFSFAQNGYLPT